MCKVRLTVVESKCRCGYHAQGDSYIVEDICPPVCHELWNCAYPMIYALQNGAVLEYGEGRASKFEVRCPDGGRVVLHGERYRE